MYREISQVKLSVTIPPDELVLVPVKINGAGPFTFVLDTGASVCCIAPELAKELKIEKRKRVPATGINSPLSAHNGVAKSISIGKALKRDIDLAIFDFSTLKKVDESIDGIIGHNFLCRYTVIINYKKNSLVLCK